MNTIQLSSECYTDKGEYAVLTRTTLLSDLQLFRIADRLRSNAEELATSSNPPIIENCRIAGEMLGLACTLVPVRVAVKFEY